MRMPQDETPRAVPDQARLAVERTYLAHERTLMAWIRTSVAMITLGFSIYKFFFFLREVEPQKPVEQLFGARAYGLVMIAIGVITLAIATWQHRRELKRLGAFEDDLPSSLSTVLAALIVSLGVVAFGAAVFRQ
jgi:putative membrane protein